MRTSSPRHDEVRATVDASRAHLGFPPAETERPVELDALELPRPRLQAPSALAPICRSDPYERALHAYGRAYRDVVRAFRGRFDHPPDVVAHPTSEAELEAVLAWCEEAGAAAIPFGGGTSVVGGVEAAGGADYAGVVTVDLKRLDRVLEIDRTSLAARIQGGATGPGLEAQLREHGLTLRHYPQSFEYSTLGGWIATRAGGHFATLATHIDDFVESVRALTPRGVWESRRLPGSGAGPSPDRMLIGSERSSRRDHRGLGAGARAAALSRLGGRDLRLVRRGGRGGPGAGPVRPSPVQLPPARPRRGGAHRRRAGREGAARARLRVRGPSARGLDGPRRRAVPRPRGRAAGASAGGRAHRVSGRLARLVPADALPARHVRGRRDHGGDVRVGRHLGPIRDVRGRGAPAARLPLWAKGR